MSNKGLFYESEEESYKMTNHGSEDSISSMTDDGLFDDESMTTNGDEVQEEKKSKIIKLEDRESEDEDTEEYDEEENKDYKYDEDGDECAMMGVEERNDLQSIDAEEWLFKPREIKKNNYELMEVLNTDIDRSEVLKNVRMSARMATYKKLKIMKELNMEEEKLLEMIRACRCHGVSAGELEYVMRLAHDPVSYTHLTLPTIYSV